jgi:hypothetical protein
MIVEMFYVSKKGSGLLDSVCLFFGIDGRAEYNLYSLSSNGCFSRREELVATGRGLSVLANNYFRSSHNPNVALNKPIGSITHPRISPVTNEPENPISDLEISIFSQHLINLVEGPNL